MTSSLHLAAALDPGWLSLVLAAWLLLPFPVAVVVGRCIARGERISYEEHQLRLMEEQFSGSGTDPETESEPGDWAA